MASEYNLDDTIVEGAFGNVYRATRSCTLKSIAISRSAKNGKVKSSKHGKESSQYGNQSSDTVDWRTELETLINLHRHENIAKYRNYFVAINNKVWIEMEYCNGGTLNNYVIQQNPNRDIKHHFMVGISAGLAFLHDLGIVHHDLTPESIMVCIDPDKPPWIKITDFGLVKLTASCNFKGKLQQFYLSSGFMTHLFMAPEVYNEQYTDKGDIFSMGVIFLSIIPTLSVHELDDKYYLVKKYKEDAIGRYIHVNGTDLNCATIYADKSSQNTSMDPNSEDPSSNPSTQKDPSPAADKRPESNTEVPYEEENVSKQVLHLLDSLIVKDHTKRPTAKNVNTILRATEAKDLCLVEVQTYDGTFGSGLNKTCITL